MSKPTKQKLQKRESRTEIIAKISAENRAYFEALGEESEIEPTRKKAKSSRFSLSAIVVALILIAGFVSGVRVVLFEIDDWKHPDKRLSQPSINSVAAQTQSANNNNVASDGHGLGEIILVGVVMIAPVAFFVWLFFWDEKHCANSTPTTNVRIVRDVTKPS